MIGVTVRNCKKRALNNFEDRLLFSKNKQDTL